MTPVEVAKFVGVQPSTVRGAIRNGCLKAKKVKSKNNQFGYVYEVSEAAAKKYKAANPSHVGWPRGVSRSKAKKVQK